MENIHKQTGTQNWFITLITTLLFCCNAYSKCSDRPVVVAVIDTGFGYRHLGHGAHLCNMGHKDFTQTKIFSTEYGTKDPVPVDFHSHGTNIVGVIEDYASKTHTNYCIVVLKYYSVSTSSAYASAQAINYAVNIGADYINYSGGGDDPENSEKKAVERALDKGIKFIAAAGNNGRDIGKIGYYPASYDNRITVVGGLDEYGKTAYFSNYGTPVTKWELGFRVQGYGIELSGTSQATAIETGKLVSYEKNKCDIR